MSTSTRKSKSKSKAAERTRSMDRSDKSKRRGFWRRCSTFNGAESEIEHAKLLLEKEAGYRNLIFYSLYPHLNRLCTVIYLTTARYISLAFLLQFKHVSCMIGMQNTAL